HGSLPRAISLDRIQESYSVSFYLYERQYVTPVIIFMQRMHPVRLRKTYHNTAGGSPALFACFVKFL
ncbi:MAG: hypothetical protein ACLR9W_11280, partial [Enterobacter hormaechei]